MQTLDVMLTASDGVKNGTLTQAAARASMEDGAYDEETFVAAI